jgi:hypothetical protein
MADEQPPSSGPSRQPSSSSEVVAGAVFEELSEEDAARAKADQGLALPEIDSVITPEVEDYNQSRALDDARWKLSLGLLIILILVIVLTVGVIATTKLTGVVTTDITHMFETMFTAVVTLLSAATGFYFGARVDSKTTGDDGGTTPTQARRSRNRRR